MKILFVLEYHYPHIGGVETLFKQLTEQLAKKGFEVAVLTNRHNNKLPKLEIINGVTIYRYSFYNRYIFTLFAFFRAFILARKYDLIHTTSYNAAIPAYFAGLFTGKKVIITFHEVWGDLWYTLPFINKVSSFLHHSFESVLIKLPFYKFIAVSEYTRQSLINRGISESRVVKIYNGINYHKIEQLNKGIESEKKETLFQFCYFGRLGISKGIDILLPAIAQCKSKGCSFHFLLIIPSEIKSFNEYVRRQIKELQLDDTVRILHDLKRADLLHNVSSSDAVIIPSYSEGFGFTAAETMALDVPIISSGRGALKEVVSGKHIEFNPLTSEALASSMIDALEGKWQLTNKKVFRLQDSIDQYCQQYSSIDL